MGGESRDPTPVLAVVAVAATLLGCVVGCRQRPDTTPSGVTPAVGTAAGIATAPTGPSTLATATTAVTSGIPMLSPATTPTSTNPLIASTLLPADRDAVVVQIGEVMHSPWEPAILGQMAPTFSLLTNGYLVFSAPGGPSIDGWYQTVLPPEAVERMLARLVVDADVLGAARRSQAGRPEIRTRADGQAGGEGHWHAIYVNSTKGEGRIVLSATELQKPPPTWGKAADALRRILAALDMWRSAVAQPLDPDAIEAVETTLGWWQPDAQPFTPDAVVISATMAPPYAPATAATLLWPLARPLAELAGVPFGGPPAEVLLSGEDAVLVWRRSREAVPGFWGPLWRDGSGGQRFLVGVRIAPPAGNHLLWEYDYAVPPEGMQTAATAEPTGPVPTP